MQSRRQSQFGWQPWATRCPHVPNVSIQRVFWNVSIFRRRSMISWAPCFILYSWQVVKQWHVPNVATGKFFVGELRFQVCSSRTICVEQMCLKRIPFVCPTNIFISHGMRRGAAKQRREQYAKVATRDTDGFDPIGIWKLLRSNGETFFLLPPVTGYCWFLSGCRTMRCSAVNQPLIKLAVLLSPYVG